MSTEFPDDLAPVWPAVVDDALAAPNPYQGDDFDGVQDPDGTEDDTPEGADDA